MKVGNPVNPSRKSGSPHVVRNRSILKSCEDVSKKAQARLQSGAQSGFGSVNSIKSAKGSRATSLSNFGVPVTKGKGGLSSPAKSMSTVRRHAPKRLPHRQRLITDRLEKNEDQFNAVHAYCMVVQQKYGKWSYVTVLDDGLCCALEPHYFEEGALPQLEELHRRVVHDQGLNWSDSVLIDTFRIVEVSLRMRDVTAEVVGGEDELEFRRQLAAASKLTPEEAKALGLERIKTKQLMLHVPEHSPIHDGILFERLYRAQMVHDLGAFIS